MLFAAGVGIGMTFYGAAEPLSYYTGVFGTPLNVSPESEEAYRLAFSATIFHWGLNAWSVYAIIGLALAFFCYNWKLPLTIRSIFYPLLGNRIWGWQGDIIDIIAVLATLFGLTTSLGLGAQQAASGLFYLFDLPNNLLTQSLVIVFITSVVIFSVYRGLDKGADYIFKTLNGEFKGTRKQESEFDPGIIIFVIIVIVILILLSDFAPTPRTAFTASFIKRDTD